MDKIPLETRWSKAKEMAPRLKSLSCNGGWEVVGKQKEGRKGDLD